MARRCAALHHWRAYAAFLFALRLFMLGATLVSAVTPGIAVEGAMGRTLPGFWIMPQAGVVGPQTGFSFTILPIGYTGGIGGARRVPIGGMIFSNVEANVSSNYLISQYVFKTVANRVTFSSSFFAVVNWQGAHGLLEFNAVVNASRPMKSANAGLGDVAVQPLTAGIHFSENNNLAISTMIFAPTGPFSPGSLTNLGMGEWTIMPNAAHTYLWKKHRLEFDNFIGCDVYRQNQETKYTSGTMFHWDGMAIKYLSDRVGFGAIGSNLTQISNDTGPAAKVLHGFEGRASGLGLQALYVAKTEKPGLVFQLRWITEFKVTNLMKGNLFMFAMTLNVN
jgi:hypothetical protein